MRVAKTVSASLDKPCLYICISVFCSAGHKSYMKSFIVLYSRRNTEESSCKMSKMPAESHLKGGITNTEFWPDMLYFV